MAAASAGADAAAEVVGSASFPIFSRFVFNTEAHLLPALPGLGTAAQRRAAARADRQALRTRTAQAGVLQRQREKQIAAQQAAQAEALKKVGGRVCMWHVGGSAGGGSAGAAAVAAGRASTKHEGCRLQGAGWRVRLPFARSHLASCLR